MMTGHPSARLVVSLALALATALVAWPAGEAGAQPRPVRAAAIFSIPNPAALNGWDRAQYEGVQHLISKHGWQVTIAEAVPFPRLAETAARYAESGYDAVIFTSSGHIGAWKEVAPRYPKTWFVLMSAVDTLPDAPNVVAYNPDFYAYGVLVGATAATASTARKIAAVGGAPVHALVVMFSGIIEGARAVRPEVEVATAFSGSWTDVPKVREVTTLQIQRGADIVFACAGASTKGILEAAEHAKVLTIGYVTDWYPDSPSTMTGVLMNIPGWYEALARDVAGKRLERKIVTFGIESFGLADFRGTIPPAREKEVRAVFARIQGGEVKVPVKHHPVK
jgi:basic membrane protein A